MRDRFWLCFVIIGMCGSGAMAQEDASAILEREDRMLAAMEKMAEEAKQTRETIERLEARIDELETQVAELSEAQGEQKDDIKLDHRHHVSRGPDHERLGEIELPEDPLEEDVRQYLQAIIDATEGQNHYNFSHDPQPKMIAQVPHEHVEVVFEFMRHHMFDYYAIHSLKRMLKKEDEPLLREHLDSYPELVQVVVSLGLVDELSDVLVEGIKKPRMEALPSVWITTVARMKDPETYDGLIDQFCRRSRWQASGIYQELLLIDDFPIDKAVKKAWPLWKYSQNDAWGMAPLAAIAASHGHVDALHQLAISVKELHEQGNAHHFHGMMNPMLTLQQVLGTDIEFDIEELPNWINENRDQLHWNADRRQYELVDELM